MDYGPMVTYARTQSYPQLLVGFISLFAIVMYSMSVFVMRAEDGSGWLAIFILVWTSIVYLALLNFSRLTVAVTAGTISLKWRLGWPNKTIDRLTIAEAAPRRNAWWVGFGIRKVSHGWMWNVWGLDAVNLVLNDGRHFRIGTDDPEGLTTALQS